MKKIAAMIRCVLAAAMLFGLASAAASAQAASASSVVNITGTIVYTADATVGEGETLYIRNGGTLFIMNGATLTVNGKLKCADGGAIYCRGDIDVTESGSASITGKLKVMSSGTLNLSGRLSVNKNGIVKGAGKIQMQCDYSSITCKGTVTAKIQAPAPVTEDGVTTVGGVVLVNREYGLPEDYGSKLNRSAYSAFLKMKSDSGYDMSIVSGYRSYEKQGEVYEYWCEIDGEETASRYSALPGHSEHQTGLAMDITSLNTSYADTDEGRWLAENCYKYGFIIRYPKDKESVTGYVYEPWHIRYLGTSLAKLVYDSGLTLEEFFCL